MTKKETQPTSNLDTSARAARRCFVISPIGEEGSDARIHADDVYEFIIAPAMKGLGIEPLRSDHLMEAGRITDQMFREIVQSDLCIAVLTGFNPNVFYELAVAQCAARPVVILIEKGMDLPFDVKDLRTVQYQMQPVRKLVEGHYAKLVKEQIINFENQGWSVGSLFEQHGYQPKLTSESQVRNILDASRPKPLPEKLGKTYVIPKNPAVAKDFDRMISVVSGDVVNLKNKLNLEADVIINLLDVDLQQGRYYDPSLSGVLRYLDADKTYGGRIEKDTLTEQLLTKIQELDIKLPVVAGSVIYTPTNQLRELGYKYVFHVGAKEGSVGKGYSLRNEVLGISVHNAYRQFDQLASTKRPKISSMLFPMLGAASTSMEAKEVVRKLLEAIINELRSGTSCKTTYLVAWLDSHRLALEKVLSELKLDEVS